MVKHRKPIVLTIVPLGDSAVRFTLPATINPRTLANTLRTLAGVTDVVITEQFASVYFTPEKPVDFQHISQAVEECIHTVTSHQDCPPRTFVINVEYQGEDLQHVAQLCKHSVDEVIALHTSVLYTVKFIGFMPGFAYLGDVPPQIVVPRLSTPRVAVPAHSVAIAGRKTGIYPFVSPGGWNLIGTAKDFLPFTTQHGSTLSLGDYVRFHPV